LNVANSVLTPPQTVTLDLLLLCCALMMPDVLLAGVFGSSCTRQLSAVAAVASAASSTKARNWLNKQLSIASTQQITLLDGSVQAAQQTSLEETICCSNCIIMVMK
jgi:hypothetical protein